MWLFVFVIYLPFFVFMLLRYELHRMSMSNIGWCLGRIQHLILYIVLTLPFCLYMLFFFNRRFTGNNKLINVISVISCVLITTGAFIPLRDEPVILFAHTLVSVGGAVLLMLTILSALILHAVRKKRKAIILSLYGIYVAALLAAFYILYTAALFQLAATVSFFLILLFINTASQRKSAPRKPLLS